MTQRLLLDEMLSPSIAERLRRAHCGAVAISASPELRGTSDPDVLELATAQQRVLVTSNVADFRPLETLWAAQGREHPGIVYVNNKAFPASRTQAGLIAAALLRRVKNNDWPGAGGADFLTRS